MSNVIVGLSVSVDGFITGREPGPGKGLGDATVLHEWYWNGDTPSRVVDGFKLFEPSRRLFDDLGSRIAAVIAGRNSYEDARGWGGAGPHPTAPLIVISHRPPPPEATEAQTFVTSIEEAIETARGLAGDGVVALMGGGVTTSALKAGLLDEVYLHQIPVLLGGGRPFFQALPEHVELSLVEVVPAPGVTHLHYRVVR